MTPLAAPTLPTPTPASDLAVAPTSQASLSAFDPSLSSAGLSAQGADPATLGTGVMRSLNGFQADLKQMQGLTAAMTSGSAAPQATPPGALQAAPQQAGATPSASGGDSNKPMVGLMMQTFNFAIETELVTRAATQFTGSVSTLMKGQ